MDDKLKQIIKQTVKEQLDAMNNLVVPFHQHNGWDNPQLDPAVSLLGFPVNQVTSATASPTDTPFNGTVRFQVDTSPKYALWVYMVYNNSGTLTGAWKGIQLTI